MRIHFAGKHALKFELVDVRGEGIDVGRYGLDSAFVVFSCGQFKQFFRAGEAVGQAANAVDDLVERSSFLAQLLRVFGIVPNGRAFEFACDFF
jgi:hypothetical protein